MFSIADTINRFWDWIATLSFASIANTYWFLFFIEVPRYYLLEYLVIFNRLMTRNKRNKEKELARFYLYRENPLISILVPGKNEGKNIYKMVKSLNEQTYRHYEIIVVDDGSDDDTKLICTDLYRAGLITHYLRLETRGGKAAATNYGANMARGKYIVSLDADSSLDRDALENVLLPFYLDNEVKAVGGCIEVRNYKETICSSLQAFEYLKRIQVGRTVTSDLGIYHIISGAFGAFERKTLKEVGFWDIGPGLDGDITQKIRKAGYKVKFAEDAICMTNVPTKWYKLYHPQLVVEYGKRGVRLRIQLPVAVVYDSACHHLQQSHRGCAAAGLLHPCMPVAAGIHPDTAGNGKKANRLVPLSVHAAHVAIHRLLPALCPTVGTSSGAVLPHLLQGCVEPEEDLQIRTAGRNLR